MAIVRTINGDVAPSTLGVVNAHDHLIRVGAGEVYIDPDHHKQNEDFTTDMEENHRVEGENLFGFGVMNLKDAPMIPNGMARNMARKRTASNGATVLADQNNTLRDAWQLGDCNNMFVLLLVSKEGDLVFMRKGPLSDADKKEFYQVVQKYR